MRLKSVLTLVCQERSCTVSDADLPDEISVLLIAKRLISERLLCRADVTGAFVQGIGHPVRQKRSCFGQRHVGLCAARGSRQSLQPQHAPALSYLPVGVINLLRHGATIEQRDTP